MPNCLSVFGERFLCESVDARRGVDGQESGKAEGQEGGWVVGREKGRQQNWEAASKNCRRKRGSQARMAKESEAVRQGGHRAQGGGQVGRQDGWKAEGLKGRRT